MSLLNSQLRLVHRFLRRHPSEMARLVQNSPPSESAELLNSLEVEDRLLLMERISPGAAAAIIRQMEPEPRDALCRELRPTQLASAFRFLSEEERRSFMERMPVARRTALTMLLNYPANAIGSWMRTDLPVLNRQATVADLALQAASLMSRFPFSHAFMVDEQRRLARAIPFQECLKSEGSTLLITLGTERFPTLSATTRLSAALDNPLWDESELVAVVNARNELVGAISHLGLRRALRRHQDEYLPDSSPDLPIELVDAFAATMRALGGSMAESVEPKKLRENSDGL